mgnify:CR=1 FL=1
MAIMTNTANINNPSTYKVWIKNVEPMWVHYSLSVEVQAGNEEEARERALELVYEGEYHIEHGPEAKSSIDGMDQTFDIDFVEKLV